MFYRVARYASKLTLPLVIALGGVGCGSRPAATAADEAAIRAQANSWFKAIEAKDLERTLSFYADNAEYLSSNRPAATTAAERRALWVQDYALPGFESQESSDQIEVARSGDLAYQTGKYELTLLDSNGKAVKSSGKWVVVWKKQQDGSWKAIVDIDNPNG